MERVGHSALGIIDPRPDQIEEIEFLERVGRGMIHSAPGKGKTLVAAYAAARHTPVIVSVPTYAAAKWAAWLRTNVPTAADHVYVATSSTMDRFDRMDTICDAAEDPLAWLIVSHGMLRPETEEYWSAGKLRKKMALEKTPSGWGWKYDFWLPDTATVIIDEAHWLRGRNALMSQGAARRWAASAIRMYQLTATPVYKDPDDLFQQLAILWPRDPRFASYHRFVATHLRTWSDGWAKHVTGIKDTVRFATFLSEFAMRHDYLPGELPPVMNLDPIWIEPDKETRARFQTLRRTYRDGVDAYATAIEAYTQIDRITAADTHKLEAMTSWIDDNRRRFDGTNRGVLVLCQHHDAVDAVYDALRSRWPNDFFAVKIDDRVPPERRAALVEGASNVVGTWASMSEAIDASHLRLVVPYELDWTAGARYQGISRVVRERHNPNDPYPNEPILIQPIFLRHSGDGPKAMRNDGRTENMRELLAQFCQDPD